MADSVFKGDRVKFTVIIPTRERPDTLRYSLETLVAQEYQNLTILVSDNFSQDSTFDIVSSFKDPRVQYINTRKRLSMSQNWEFALDHVKEGWITFIGDDDGLLPGAIKRISEIVADNECEAVISDVCRYDWPNSGTRNNNSLLVPVTTGYEFREAKHWFKKVMSGNAGYMHLPYVYTGGFVKLSAISLRRQTYELERNASSQVWLSFIDLVAESFPEVKFIIVGTREEVVAGLENRKNVLIAKRFATTMLEDCTLVRTAAMYMGLDSGINIQAVFSDQPYLIFQSNIHKHYGLPEGGGFSFSTDSQRYFSSKVPVTTEFLLKEFSQMYPRVKLRLKAPFWGTRAD